MNQVIAKKTTDSKWKSLYKTGFLPSMDILTLIIAVSSGLLLFARGNHPDIKIIQAMTLLNPQFSGSII
jgi:hypothetical protein